MVDYKLLFSAERLRLNPRLTTGATEGNRLTVKALDDRGYLTVDQLQWDALRQFVEPHKVPDVLRQLIQERKTPALHDFFELILKAHRAGVLQKVASHGILLPAADWRLALPGKAGGWIGGIVVAFAFVAMVVRPPDLSDLSGVGLIVALVVGLLLAVLSLSLGYVLAASALHWAGGEIYRPRLQWSALLPHFTADLQDVRIMNRATRIQICLLRLAPVALVVGILAWLRPPWSFLPVATLLGLLRPVLGGRATEIITAVRGHPLLDTSHSMLFPPNRSWRALHRAARQHFDSQVVALRVVWAILWIAVVFQLGFNSAGVSVRGIWLDWHFWRLVGFVLAAVSVASLLGLLYLVTVGDIAEPTRRLVVERRLRKIRGQQPYEPVTEETVSGTLVLSPVCQRLPPPERAALAAQLHPAVHPARERLLDFAQPPKEMWLIVSGAVDVFRRTPAGRPEFAWRAVEGDLVGAENILEPRPGGWRLQSRTPLVTLAMSRAVFDEKILNRLGAPVLHALTHRVPFLRQNRLCRDWHPQALARFATLSTVVNFADREYVLHHGQENHRMFVVYEGNVRITRPGVKPRMVGPGELLGEIGMLQNGVAGADVVAAGPVVCLFLSKTDVLHFLSHNYEVALEVERVSSQRLGRPIFPMSAESFDVL